MGKSIYADSLPQHLDLGTHTTKKSSRAKSDQNTFPYSCVGAGSSTLMEQQSWDFTIPLPSLPKPNIMVLCIQPPPMLAATTGSAPLRSSCYILLIVTSLKQFRDESPQGMQYYAPFGSVYRHI